MQAHELWSTTRCTRPKLPFTRAQTMAPFMLKHDGKLNRWCSVQEDVEDYFRKTLGEVRAACLRHTGPTASRRTHGVRLQFRALTGG